MKPNLLIVDDDLALAPAMADFFTKHGCEVRCASEAEEAIAMIKVHPFDVVIADLELNSVEGLDGFNVLKALRQWRPAAKVIVYSGHTDETIIKASLGNGAARFFPKPVSLYQLLSCAEELWQTHC